MSEPAPAEPALLLRPLHPGDRATIGQLILAADDLHGLTTGHELPWGQVDVDAFLERALDAHRLGTAYTFGIMVDERLIGVVELLDVRPRHSSARIGLAIWDPSDRGQGFGKAAVREVAKVAFERLALTRLWATVVIGNDRSKAVFERLGFRMEGTLREHVWMAGSRRDVEVFGLLAVEWF